MTLFIVYVTFRRYLLFTGLEILFLKGDIGITPSKRHLTTNPYQLAALQQSHFGSEVKGMAPDMEHVRNLRKGYIVMNFKLRRMCRVFSALTILFLLGGCAILPKDKMATSSTDYNIVVEKAHNEMLLLNILRASKRRPFHITDFQLLRGNMKYSFSTGDFTVPFGQAHGTGGDVSYSIAPSIAYATNPNFDLVVWNDQEFTNGFMTPIKKETFSYYLEQGWPKEMLFSLFIRRLIIDENEFLNYPEDSGKFDKFQEEIMKCDMKKTKEKVPIGPRLKESDVDLEQLITIRNTPGLTIEAEAGRYQLKSEEIDYVFTCGNKSIGMEGTGKDKLFLRSPEAILYYLGEIARAEMEDDFVPLITWHGDNGENSKCPLFVISKSADKAATVKVKYDGEKYMIPKPDDKCPVDNSMHVLSVVSQLIGLQRKAEKAPVTGVVTVTGQ